MPTRRRTAATAGLLMIALLCLLATPPAAYAHAGNRLELYVHDFTVRPAGPGKWIVHAELIDADSGRPAPGFEVVASGAAGTGRFGPVTLDDPASTGQYEAVVSGPPGPWTVTVEAKARLGGEAAVPFARTWNVAVTEAGTAQATHAEAPAPAEPGEPGAPAIEVRVERGSEKGPNEFYVPILVTVLDTPTGQPSPHPFDVFAAAANRAGETTESFPLVELAEEGRHRGFVIVPHGGPWTVTATVSGRRDERNPKPPVTYARASLDLDVAAGSLGSARDPAGRVPRRGVNIADLTVMWLHGVFGLGSVATAGLLGVMAVPAGRRLLSERARNTFDHRLALISRTAAWLGGLVALTGAYNLGRSVPYRVPLSTTAAEHVFRLPYAQPYFAALAVKLAAFAAAVPCVVNLAVRARRLAAVGGGGDARRSAGAPAERADPWRTPAPALVGARRAGEPAPSAQPPRSTVTPSPSPSLPSRPALPVEGGTALPLGGLIPVIVLTAAATLITVAVTVLKYLHLLSEAARATSG